MRKDDRDRMRIQYDDTFKKALEELSVLWNSDDSQTVHKAVYEALERERMGDATLNGISKKLDQILVTSKNIEEEISS